MEITDEVKKRFWSKVEKTEGCWLWKNPASRKGYGQFWFNRKYILAHRISYIINNGPIPIDKIICHSCDNPCCVRPDHLFIGTYKENTMDMVIKERNERGEGRYNAKLREEDIYEIRFQSSQCIPQRTIARQFGVSQSAISHVLRGINWKHTIK